MQNRLSGAAQQGVFPVGAVTPQRVVVLSLETGGSEQFLRLYEKIGVRSSFLTLRNVFPWRRFFLSAFDPFSFSL
jgi:hypothetical protein